MAEAPPFIPENQNQHVVSGKNLTISERQYMVDYCLRNLQTDDNGNDDIDGVLIVKSGVVSRLAKKLARNNFTIQMVLSERGPVLIWPILKN